MILAVGKRDTDGVAVAQQWHAGVLAGCLQVMIGYIEILCGLVKLYVYILH